MASKQAHAALINGLSLAEGRDAVQAKHAATELRDLA